MTRQLGVRTLVRLVPLCVGLTLIAYLATRLGLREILGMFSDLRWSIAPVLSLYAGHQVTRAAALTWCVARPRALRFVDAFGIRLSGEAVEFLTFTGPLMSEPTKAWLLQRSGLDVSEGLAATLTEYLASTVAAAVTAMVGVSYVLVALQPVGPIRVAAIIVLVSMSVFVGLVAVGIATRVRIVGTLVSTVMRRTIPALDGVEVLMIRTAREAPQRLFAILALEFAAQAFLGLELWSLLFALHLPCTIVCAALMEGVVKFMNAGSFLVPGQIGVAEGTYAVMFTVFGLPAAAGVTIAFARRLRSLVTALVGLIALVSLRVPVPSDSHEDRKAPRVRSRAERSPRRRRFNDERRERSADGNGDEQHRDRLVLSGDAEYSEKQ